MKKTILMLVMCMLASTLMLSCIDTNKEDKDAEKESKESIEKKAKALKELCPGKLWDGWQISDVTTSDNNATINLMDDWDSEDISGIERDPNRLADFFIENLCEGYYEGYYLGKGGEGDEEVYKAAYELVEAVSDGDGDIELKLVDRNNKKVSVPKIKLSNKKLNKYIKKVNQAKKDKAERY